jgi:molybdopterin-containing oxidoreductase family iron-sulfur binding subunit
MGSSENYYNVIRKNWEQNILENVSWNQALHDGFFKARSKKSVNKLKYNSLKSAELLSKAQSSGMELVLYSKTGLGDGQQANNPWLQEFPDPITRVSWDNYLTISKIDAKNLGLKNENVANGALDSNYANIKVGDVSLKVPVLIQPGQAVGTVGLAFGYGKTDSMKKEMQVGVNAYKLYKNFNSTQIVEINSIDETHEFACVQLHNTLMGRGDIIKETTLEVFNTKKVEDWNAITNVSLNHIETPVNSPEVDLWDEFDRSIGHHFNLSIDLNACTGCGACVIACHAENNVPVVGKAEVRRSRDMHWLRIDRYYSSEETFGGDNKTKDDISGLSDSLSVFGEMENPSENPQVVFQPVMCQHCNHAPCETVCPVAATSHGRQGQNHMAYNRCIGTRYCANNCPYKVRRFNWFLYNNNDEFDFNMNDDLGKMVLNPDVVVRSRGVMEKCSFCIQSTQAVILNAKREGRLVEKGEFNDTCACSAACSTGAMKFGDINEELSEVSELKESERVYHLLDTVGTKPNVFYHVKIRNTDET